MLHTELLLINTKIFSLKPQFGLFTLSYVSKLWQHAEKYKETNFLNHYQVSLYEEAKSFF
jgi:hypothetical protein